MKEIIEIFLKANSEEEVIQRRKLALKLAKLKQIEYIREVNEWPPHDAENGILLKPGDKENAA